jgi:hypothetical protein
VAINILGEKDGDVEGWVRAKGWSIPAVVGTDLPELQKKYPITGAPETFLLDREGRRYSHLVGFERGQELVVEAEIRLMLGLDPFTFD